MSVVAETCSAASGSIWKVTLWYSTPIASQLMFAGAGRRTIGGVGDCGPPATGCHATSETIPGRTVTEPPSSDTTASPGRLPPAATAICLPSGETLGGRGGLESLRQPDRVRRAGIQPPDVSVQDEDHRPVSSIRGDRMSPGRGEQRIDRRAVDAMTHRVLVAFGKSERR